jgi:hypothetical protein
MLHIENLLVGSRRARGRGDGEGCVSEKGGFAWHQKTGDWRKWMRW